MPSSLRIQHTPSEPIEATHSYFPSAPPRPAKKQKMSLTQTYYIAASARSKLGREACRPDHDLRLLVGHANLLDSLMVELADAEREQDAWFNQTVKNASREEVKSRHVEWTEDTIMEEDDSDDSASDSSDDSEFDYDFEMIPPVARAAPPPAIHISSVELDEEVEFELDSDEEDFYDDDEDDEVLALTRVASHSNPPELIEDDESSEDESPPASPPQASLEYEKQPALYETEQEQLSPPSSPQQELGKNNNYFISGQENNLLIASF